MACSILQAGKLVLHHVKHASQLALFAEPILNHKASGTEYRYLYRNHSKPVKHEVQSAVLSIEK